MNLQEISRIALFQIFVISRMLLQNTTESCLEKISKILFRETYTDRRLFPEQEDSFLVIESLKIRFFFLVI